MTIPAGTGPMRTDAETTTGRWRLRNWPLREKLVAVLLVPLLLAGTLGGLRVAASVDDAAQLDAGVEQVESSRITAFLIDEVQRERVLAVAFVAVGRTGDRAALDAQMVRVDDAVAAFSAIDPASFGAAMGTVSEAARVRVAGLEPLRKAVLETAYPADRVAITYNSIVDPLLALQRAALTSADGALLRQAGDAVIVADAKEQVQRQRATVLAVLLTGSATPLQQVAVRAADAQLSAALTDFVASALPATRALYDATVAGAEVDNRERLEQRVLSALASDAPLPPVAAEWDTSAGRTADLVRQVEIALQGQIADAGADLAADARGAAIRDGVVVVVLVVLAMVLLVLVARSLIRPLRALRLAAFDVAERRLPEAIERMRTTDGEEPTLYVEPIGVDTREEIGEVARAFDAVHAEAVRLAAQQALLRNNVNDIFVNLSRRSQGLVGRQLRLIDELEKTEQDPEHLGNLFQLDHLATRMRRNNENLLVLAGAAELRPRRKRPVPAQDVLRAAVSEVEQYRRVTVRRAPDVAIAGPVVNDLVHLVAELLDNATTFSPPESPVVLEATWGEGGRLVLEIRDSGVGIEPDELALTNAQLATPPVVDVAVSRRMGLFVVGRLAARHNIAVVLRPSSAGSGLVAAVDVPAVYLQNLTTTGEPRTGGLRLADLRPADLGPAEPRSPEPGPVHGSGPRAVTLPEQAARVEPPRPAPALPAWPTPAPAAAPRLPEPAAPRPRLPEPAADLPRRDPGRADGPVPAGDPLSSPWAAAGTAGTAGEGEDLPIYGEMRSAWFRQRRFAPVLEGWSAGGPAAGSASAGAVARPPANGHGSRRPAGPQGPSPAPPAQRSTDQRPDGVPSAQLPSAQPSARPAEPGRPTWPVRPADPSGPDGGRTLRSGGYPAVGGAEPATFDAAVPAPEAPAPRADDWGSGDAGWQAARSAAGRDADDVTAAGLPKRRPRAQLVPGTAGEAAPVRPPTRSPEMIRGRLSGYQQGLRQGREARRAAASAHRDTAARGEVD